MARKPARSIRMPTYPQKITFGEMREMGVRDVAGVQSQARAGHAGGGLSRHEQAQQAMTPPRREPFAKWTQFGHPTQVQMLA
jgi:hypothetical protein